MKNKISVTVEHSLIEFLDSLPGESRSQKIERALLQLKRVTEEMQLRVLLGGVREDGAERVERDVWEKTVAEAMWNE